MESLSEYVPHFLPDELKITEIRSGILYFVHMGRNAWHSTWVQKYYRGCFHETFESAAKYCESRRINGTCFYIIETPTLILRAGIVSIYVTQINVKCPLYNYSANAVIPKEEYEGDLIEHPKDNYMHVGSPIKNAVLTFDNEGRFWKSPPQSNTPVITLISYKSDSPVKPSGNSELKSYLSSSHGKKYYLGWNSFKINRDPNGVIGIVYDANESAKVLKFIAQENA